MKLAAVFNSLETLVAKIGGFLQSPLLLGLRLYWGWSFAQTGWGKLMHLDRTAGYFSSLGIPAPTLNTIMAGGTECVGGVLLLIGFGSRLVSVPLAFVMIVAYATADREAVKAIFSDPEKFVTASPFLFLLTVALVLAFGPGRFSVDAWRKGGDA